MNNCTASILTFEILTAVNVMNIVLFGMMLCSSMRFPLISILCLEGQVFGMQ